MPSHRAVVTVPLGSASSSRRYVPRSSPDNIETTARAMDGSSHTAVHARVAHVQGTEDDSAAASKRALAQTQRTMRRVMSFRPESLSPPNNSSVGGGQTEMASSSTIGRTALRHLEQSVPGGHSRGAAGGKRSSCSNCCPWSLRNFILFSVLFSLNHGCLSSILSLAPAQLQTGNIGSYGLGVFFVCAVVMALFFAVAIVDRIGSKWAMVAAMVSSALNVCVFLGSFMLDSKLHEEANVSLVEPPSDGGGGGAADVPASADPLLAGATGDILLWFSYMTGSAIGGAGAGLMWSAQGPYFRYCAEDFAATKEKMSTSSATGIFAGAFAAVFLALECSMKLCGSLLWNVDPSHGPLVLFGVYSAVSVACCPLFMLVKSINSPKKQAARNKAAAAATTTAAAAADGQSSAPEKSAKPPAAPARFLAAIRLCFVHSPGGARASILLLTPKQVTFGAMSSMVACYVSAVLVVNSVGAEYIGYLTAIVPATAGVLQIPFTFMGRVRHGREVAMVLGDLAMLVLALVCFSTEMQITLLGAATSTFSKTSSDVSPNGDLTNLTTISVESEAYGHIDLPLLIGLYLLMGVGRASYEGSNRATIADVFQERAVEAFAAQLGVAATSAFFLCPEVPHVIFTGVCAALALGAVCSLSGLFCRSHYRRLWDKAKVRKITAIDEESPNGTAGSDGHADVGDVAILLEDGIGQFMAI